jgi:thiamine pyrophosphate-dependent acetolactate synthase large subunit-like protein
MMKLADAYAIAGRRAKDHDGLRRELRAAFAANEPTLIEVPVGPMESLAGRNRPSSL